MPAERASTAPRRRVLILGAAGRDFHDFNVVFRDAPAYEVVGFTAAQIPNIAGRTYPPQLAGPLYPAGSANPEAGMFVIRAKSFEEAEAIIREEPLHKAGLRQYTLQKWRLNEGSYTVTVNYSDQSVQIA